MDSFPSTTNDEGSILLQDKDVYADSSVDPFLVEALQNPRHRLTILRMELDIQKFLQNSDVEQFEFQHFPTSYLRLAAHRVSQHYGLQTMVQDNALDGQGTKIVVMKTAESRCSAIMHLSEIPITQLGSEKHDNVKIFLRPKPLNASNEASELGMKRSTVRTVEERKEDYDKARARIFSSSINSESENAISQVPIEGKILCTTVPERSLGVRDVGMPSLVATFKDRDKDLTDPDYDRRSYKRISFHFRAFRPNGCKTMYVQKMPTAQGISSMPFSMQNFHGPFVQYGVFPQMAHHHQPSVTFGAPMMNRFCANGLGHQKPIDVAHMQWPTSTMMYAQSHDQFRHAFFPAPYSHQQPLSFGYSQNY